jgi:hypothetical protein
LKGLAPHWARWLASVGEALSGLCVLCGDTQAHRGSQLVRQSAVNLLNNTHANFATYSFIILLVLFSIQHVSCHSVYSTSTESKSVVMAQPASYTNPLKKFKYSQPF